MKRSISARVRKLSDAAREVLVHSDLLRSRDDSACGHPHREREPRLHRALSHRLISKNDIRPYPHVDPSSSTLDLWVGGGKVKGDVERSRTGANTPVSSQFSADTEALDVQPQRGRNGEKKALLQMGLKKHEKAKPVRPPRPQENVLSGLYGEPNAEGLAPPPACAVRYHEREEEERQRKQMQELRHRGSDIQTGQAVARRAGIPDKKVQVNDEVGPPVPPKDYVPAKMSSPFAPIYRSRAPTSSRDASQCRPNDDGGADLNRGLSTRSDPTGTAGVSKLVAPRRSRPITFDERRQELDMLYATTGHVQAPRRTVTLRRMPSSEDTSIQTPTRSPQHPGSRPLNHLACSDANEQYRERTESRPYKPSPFRSRQPAVAPKVPFPHQPDVCLPNAHHKRRPSEMDIPVDVFADDGEHFLAPGRPYGQPHAVVCPPGSVRPLNPKPKPVPFITSTRMTTKVEGTVHTNDSSIPRPVKISMTIATPAVAKGHPESCDEDDIVVIAPFSPTVSFLSTEAKLIESFGTTPDPRSPRQDTYTRQQLEVALKEVESVLPLSIRKKENTRRVGRS